MRIASPWADFGLIWERILRQRGEVPNVHVEIAHRLLRGDWRSSRFVDLCMHAGLHQRALEAAGGRARFMARVAWATELASATGDMSMAGDSLERLGREVDACRMAPRAAIPLVARVWHLLPGEACRILRRLDPNHPALNVLDAETGRMPEPDAATARRPNPFDRANLALMQANVAADTGSRLTRINAALSALGQSTVELSNGRHARFLDALAAGSGGRPSSPQPESVSIVMTTFNVASYLGTSLRSLLSQSWRNLEIIVVDDASTDDSWERINVLARSDTRIRALRLAENRGTYAAKNAGIQVATGDFVAFHDADDWAHPQRIEACVRAINRSAALAVSGHYVRIDDGGRFGSSRLYPLIRWSPNTVFFRRQPVIARIGFFDENRFGADSEYVARLRAEFGECMHKKTSLLHFIASHRAGSLMTGNAFGPDAQGRLGLRRDYEEWWSERIVRMLLRGVALRLEPGCEFHPASLAAARE